GVVNSTRRKCLQLRSDPVPESCELNSVNGSCSEAPVYRSYICRIGRFKRYPLPKLVSRTETCRQGLRTEGVLLVTQIVITTEYAQGAPLGDVVVRIDGR